MGNLNCKSCNCAQFFEKKGELDLKNPVHQDQELKPNPKPSVFSGRSKPPKVNYDALKPYVIRLEALWQGYTARNFIVHLKRQTKPNHGYFSANEIHETLSKKLGIPEFRQKKQSFKYTSGAVYTGQWLGGFRDGYGTMQWPDGARYQGNWSYSKPYGFGTFTHVDGDVYEGEWKICFVSPKDTFGTGNNLNRWKDMVSDGYLWLWIKQESFKQELSFGRSSLKEVKSYGKRELKAGEGEGENGKKEASMWKDLDSERTRESFSVRESQTVRKSGNRGNEAVRGKDKPTFNENDFSKIKAQNTIKEPGSSRLRETISLKVSDSIKLSESASRRESDFSKSKDYAFLKDTETENVRLAVTSTRYEAEPTNKTDSAYLHENNKEAMKESAAGKKQPHPVMRYKKTVTKNQQTLEPLNESVIETVAQPAIKVDLFPEASNEIPDLHEEISEPSNRFFEMKARVSLIESSLFDIKKSISDLITPIKQGKSHTFQQKKFDNGTIYVGELKNNQKDGRGKQIWPGGDMYEGEWQKDKQQGKGRSTWSNGNTYIGFYDNNEKSGIGEYIWGDGSSYLGEWRENKMHGVGRHRWTDGREFIGEWVEGQREGLGTMFYKNGNVYEGEFNKGKPNGQGSLIDMNGKIVKGKWNDGKFTGN